jgi:hypothetical protein
VWQRQEVQAVPRQACLTPAKVRHLRLPTASLTGRGKHDARQSPPA